MGGKYWKGEKTAALPGQNRNYWCALAYSARKLESSVLIKVHNSVKFIWRCSLRIIVTVNSDMTLFCHAVFIPCGSQFFH